MAHKPKLTRLQKLGDLSHINAREDRLLQRAMPESHGEVIRKGMLAEMGRRGDDRVTNLTREEAALLRAHGGSGTLNPKTGLREYGDGMGGSDNPGGGHNGDQGPGGVGGPSGPGHGGVSDNGGFGPDGSISGGFGNDNYGNFGVHTDTIGAPGGRGAGGRGLGYGLDGKAYGGVVGRGLEARGYDPGRGHPAVESLLAAPNFTEKGVTLSQYAPRDTWGRLYQELVNPSIKAPGRFSAPNRHGPGIVGTAVAQMVGGPFSGMMALGGAMGRASSAATQAASAAEDADRSAHNSGGNQQHHDLNEIDARLAARNPGGDRSSVNKGLLAQTPGGESSETTQVADLTIVPDNPLNPKNESSTKNFIPEMIENSMMDYIWRGRHGSLGLGFA